jgi:hypothetical protein
MNPVPFAFEDQRDAFGDDRTPVFLDFDGVLKVGDPPRLGCGDACEKTKEDRE